MSKWTPETIKEAALKCEYRGEFRLLYPGAVKSAKKLGILQEVCLHMSSTNRVFDKLTEKEVIEEAKKYSSQSEFNSKSPAASKTAKKLGIYDQVCKHMENSYTSWTYDSLKNEASKYSSKSEFQKYSNSAYVVAINRGILNNICKHMTKKHTSWTKAAIKNIAKKYDRRVDFQTNDTNAYAAAQRKGWLDQVCEHMIETFHNWTNEELKQEALKYLYRSDFQHGSKAAYLAARKKGILDEICEHMSYKDGATRLENEMYMYYVRIDTLDSSLPPIWKIGITRYADVMRRFSREINQTKTKVVVLKTWYYKEGRNAAIAEREIMKTYEQFNYKGDSPLRETKTTEMFIKDILELDKEVKHGW